MVSSKDVFRHESLQDAKSLQEILKAISKGLSKGKLVFNDDEGQVELEPKGLMNLKVSAKKDELRNRLDIRISWYDEEKEVKEKSLQIG